MRYERCFILGDGAGNRKNLVAAIDPSPYNSPLDGIPRNTLILNLVGTGRFELPTPRTPSECSTRLSHVPTGR